MSAPPYGGSNYGGYPAQQMKGQQYHTAGSPDNLNSSKSPQSTFSQPNQSATMQSTASNNPGNGHQQQQPVPSISTSMNNGYHSNYFDYGNAQATGAASKGQIMGIPRESGGQIPAPAIPVASSGTNATPMGLQSYPPNNTGIASAGYPSYGGQISPTNMHPAPVQEQTTSSTTSLMAQARPMPMPMPVAAVPSAPPPAPAMARLPPSHHHQQQQPSYPQTFPPTTRPPMFPSPGIEKLANQMQNLSTSQPAPLSVKQMFTFIADFIFLAWTASRSYRSAPSFIRSPKDHGISNCSSV